MLFPVASGSSSQGFHRRKCEPPLIAESYPDSVKTTQYIFYMWIIMQEILHFVHYVPARKAFTGDAVNTMSIFLDLNFLVR